MCAWKKKCSTVTVLLQTYGILHDCESITEATVGSYFVVVSGNAHQPHNAHITAARQCSLASLEERKAHFEEDTLHARTGTCMSS